MKAVNPVLIFVFLAIFLMLMPLMSANGVGHSEKKLVGGIIYELGRYPPVIIEGAPATFSLNVHDSASEKHLEGKVWIRISYNEGIIFSSSDFIISREGPVFFSYVFREAGNYEILVQMEDALPARYLIEVQLSAGVKELFPKIGIIIAALIVLLAAAGAMMRKSRA